MNDVAKIDGSPIVEEKISSPEERLQSNLKFLQTLYEREQLDAPREFDYESKLAERPDLLIRINNLPPHVRQNTAKTIYTISKSSDPTYIVDSMETTFKNAENVLLNPLTDLYTKSAIVGEFKSILIDYLQNNTLSEMLSSIAWISMDLDDLSRVNNFFGHPKGDEIIKEFANVIGPNSDFGKTMSDKYGTSYLAALKSGDEFYSLIAGKQNCALKELIPEIIIFFNECISKVDTSELTKIDGSTPSEIKSRLKDHNIEIFDDESLLLLFGGSIGIRTLEETLSKIDLQLEDKKSKLTIDKAFNVILRDLIGYADIRAEDFKNTRKTKIKASMEEIISKYGTESPEAKMLQFMMAKPREHNKIIDPEDNSPSIDVVPLEEIVLAKLQQSPRRQARSAQLNNPHN